MKRAILTALLLPVVAFVAAGCASCYQNCHPLPPDVRLISDTADGYIYRVAAHHYREARGLCDLDPSAGYGERTWIGRDGALYVDCDAVNTWYRVG